MKFPTFGPRTGGRGLCAFVGRAAVMVVAGLGTVLPLTGDPAQATERYRQRVVSNDYGGPVGARANQIAAMRAAGQSVAVPYGACMSACTMYLGLPGTCVGPNAVFGFHGPMSSSGLGLSQDEFERWSRVMAANYPPALRQWYMNKGRYNTVGYTAISGAQLIQMGVPQCL